MRPDIGRYLEGRLLGTVKLIKTIYDLGLGQGEDVSVSLQGKELVFSRGAEEGGSGFLRLLPGETWLVLSFPRGAEIPDPMKRLKGVPGSRMRTQVRESIEIDPYLRRIIEAAYELG